MLVGEAGCSTLAALPRGKGGCVVEVFICIAIMQSWCSNSNYILQFYNNRYGIHILGGKGFLCTPGSP